MNMISKLTIVAFLLVSALAAQQLSSDVEVGDLPKLPVYLGVGYNLLKGNPLADHVDEGFAHPIYKQQIP